MDQEPARVDIDTVHQQVDRALAVRGQAVIHLAGLFADMDVRRPLRERLRRPLQIVERDGPQRMRRDAGGAVRHRGLHQACIGLARVEEAALAVACGLAQKAALAIEHGQQGEADAGCVGRGHDALRHLADIVVRPAVWLVMQVMKFRHRGEAGL